MTQGRIDVERAKALLKERLRARMQKSGNYPASIEGLNLYRRDDTANIEQCIYKPMIALVIRGDKRISVGSNEYACTENNVLIAGVDVPATAIITKASASIPCMSIALILTILCLRNWL
ncbi:MAG: AraC family transcriptional regulator [Helicobacteraceae bacterium]|jgi:hypothetical protein|nr:AraC family transcriptional regulator [Helicobacteraceae bacterium]